MMNEFIITINNKKYEVTTSENGKTEVNGIKVNTELTRLNDQAFLLRFNNRLYEVTSNKITNGSYGFTIAGWYFEATVRTRLQETANELMNKKNKDHGRHDLKAPMPGLILKLKKKIGDSVSVGEPLLILEAMKMENEVRSISSGIIKNIYISEGESVEKGSLILTIE